MHTRRSFLLSSSLFAASAAVPLFVSRSTQGMAAEKDSRVLVVIELDGGNDALNTIVPFADPLYEQLRPKLKLNPKNLIPLNASLGLHSSLKPLDKLLDAGQLAAMPGVGHPNPNRSHFESMAIWHTARLDAEDRKGYGWLGRALDRNAGSLYSVGRDVPAALRGRRSTAIAFNRIDNVIMTDSSVVMKNPGTDSTSDDALGFVRRQTVFAHQASTTLAKFAEAKNGSRYPQTALGERLKLASRVLKADLGVRVFYTQQSGYDTHAQQQFTHASLLEEFAAAVAAFFVDLNESKLADRVTLFAFSEFGRTIRENNSGGTDHGTAGATFVVGPTVRGGVVGTMPNLTDLVDGEPKMTIDFRQIYNAVLSEWMNLPADEITQQLTRIELFKVDQRR
jgi:uncharacterized protein (DUF1501 family)